jgi:hypothetical protein
LSAKEIFPLEYIILRIAVSNILPQHNLQIKQVTHTHVKMYNFPNFKHLSLIDIFLGGNCQNPRNKGEKYKD